MAWRWTDRLEQHAADMRRRAELARRAAVEVKQRERERVERDQVLRASRVAWALQTNALRRLTPYERDVWRWQNDPDWCGPRPTPFTTDWDEVFLRAPGPVDLAGVLRACQFVLSIGRSRA
jgi:hypothetical protein